MIKGRGVPTLLLILVMTLRPHMAGDAYPFAQGLLLIPLLIGLALLLLTSDRTEPVQGRRRFVLILPWVLFLWSLITLLWTTDPGQGLRVSAALLSNVTVFTIAYLLMRNEKRFQARSLPMLGVVVIPVLTSALYQRMFGLERIRETLSDMALTGEHVADLALIITDNRVFAGFLNPNMLAGFLGVGICLSLDLLLTASGRRHLIFYSLLTAAQCGVLILTGSLGGTLAALAMAGAVLLTRRTFRTRDAVLAGTVMAAFVGGLLAIRGIGFLTGQESSLVQRGGYMAAGIEMALVHPLVGWGTGSVPGALMGFVGEGVRPVADPHNFLVRSWIAWGIPGILTLLTFLLMWMATGFRFLRDARWRSAPGGYAGLLFGGVAFLGHSMLDMDFFVPETALFGWFALGAAFGLAATHEKSEIPGELESGKGRAFLSGAAALALVLPVFVLFQGESLAYRAGKAAAERDFETAAELFSDARAMIPVNGRFALDEGRVRSAAGQQDRADELFQEAEGLMRASPYPPWEMGRAALARGEWENAILFLERSLSRYRTSPRIRIDLARAYLKLGDTARALRLLQEARRVGMFDLQAQALADDILSRLDR